MKEMELLDSFLQAIAADSRVGPVHISLYLALFQCWQMNNCLSPFTIQTCSVMKTSKIMARTTYNKIMKELSRYGYIRYLPSKYPLKRSMVHLPTTHQLS